MTRQAGFTFPQVGCAYPHRHRPHRLLRKRIYMGDFEWKGRVFQGTYPAIVSREVWQRLPDTSICHGMEAFSSTLADCRRQMTGRTRPYAMSTALPAIRIWGCGPVNRPRKRSGMAAPDLTVTCAVPPLNRRWPVVVPPSGAEATVRGTAAVCRHSPTAVRATHYGQAQARAQCQSRHRCGSAPRRSHTSPR